MPHSTSTIIPGESAPSVKLRCGNLRSGFLIFSLLFWLFTIVFLCGIAEHITQPRIAHFAREINTFFSTPGRMMIGPIFILFAMVYFIYGRETITWYNGVIINEKPIAIAYYQFKKLTTNTTLIYLQSTAGKRWILYPVTSQDNIKFKNAVIAKKESALNEIQLELLQSKLAASGAAEKRFMLLTRNLVISFVVVVLVLVLAFLFF